MDNITNNKVWYTSKTLWTNIVAFIALITQQHYGYVIDPQIQAEALIGINMILRIITKSPVVFVNDSPISTNPPV